MLWPFQDKAHLLAFGFSMLRGILAYGPSKLRCWGLACQMGLHTLEQIDDLYAMSSRNTESNLALGGPPWVSEYVCDTDSFHSWL